MKQTLTQLVEEVFLRPDPHRLSRSEFLNASIASFAPPRQETKLMQALLQHGRLGL